MPPSKLKPAQTSEPVTTPDMVVLALLAERPMHGYQLNLELERRAVRDWAGISRPQVYYSLAKLHRDKLVVPVRTPVRTKGKKKASVGRRPQVYRLTPSGRAALADALERPDWATRRVPPPFLTWLALSPHARPGVASRQLERRRQFLQAEIEKERATLVAVRADSGPMTGVAALMVELTIRQIEVELDWLSG